MTDTERAVADLQSRWYVLHDQDRVQEIKSIQESGMSLKELAAFLNYSPSLLSRLLRADRAPVECRVRARRDTLSTRALARYVFEPGTRCSSQDREAIAFEKERAAHEGCQTILTWLACQEVSLSDHQHIIKQAGVRIALAEPMKVPSRDVFNVNTPIDEIINDCRQMALMEDEDCIIACLGDWLARWSLRWIQDSWVRLRAIDLAYDERSKYPEG
jgi:DNA-binding transcriptional MerR regulator